MPTPIKTYNALNGEELLKVAFSQAFERFQEHWLFKKHAAFHNPVIRFTIEVAAFDSSEGYKRTVSFQTAHRSQEQISIPTSPAPQGALEIHETITLEPSGEIRYPDKARTEAGLPIPTPSPSPVGIVDELKEAPIPAAPRKPPLNRSKTSAKETV